MCGVRVCSLLCLARFAAVCLAFLAIFSMAGCGGSTSSTSGASTPTPPPPPTPSPTPSSVDVTTYHYDNLRTGQNLNEITLTTANVNQAKFGKLGELMVDGKVDAQPLYLSNVSMPSVGAKNLLYVATEHGMFSRLTPTTSEAPRRRLCGRFRPNCRGRDLAMIAAVAR